MRVIARHRWVIPSVLAALYALTGGTLFAVGEASILVVMVFSPWAGVALLILRFGLIPWFPLGVTALLVFCSVLVWLGIRRQRWKYAVAILLGLLVLVTESDLYRGFAFVWAGTIMLALGLFLGNIWRLRGLHKDQLNLLQNREDHIRRNERLKLARDLHDIVAHQLSAVALQSMSYQGSSDSDELREGLTQIRQANNRAQEELSTLNQVLQGQPEGPAEGTLSPEELEAVRERLNSAGFAVEWSADISEYPLGGSMAGSTRRVLQELTTNITKYADPQQPVSVSVRSRADALIISASNGLTQAASRFKELSNGWGLTGVRERVDLHGGTMSVEADRRRWKISVSIPRQSVPEFAVVR